MSIIRWLIPADLFFKKKLCFTKMFEIIFLSMNDEEKDQLEE